MFRIQYFSLRRLNGRIFWAFVGLALLMLATGIGANLLVSTAETTNQQQLFRLSQASDIKDLRASLDEQRNNLDLITLYKVRGVLEFFTVNSIIRTTITLKEINRNFPPDDEAYTQFNTIVTDYNSIATLASSNLGKSKTPDEEDRLYVQLKEKLDALESPIATLVQDRQRAADLSRNNYLATLDGTRWIYLIVAVILFVMAVFFAILIARLVARPLSILVGYLRSMATGNLTKQMDVRGTDEVMELGLIFNRTVFNLKQVLTRIRTQVSNVRSTSQQIITSSDAQAEISTNQAEAIAQTAETMDNLSASSQLIADSAAQVADSANLALTSANQSYNTMLNTSQTMSEIRQKVNLIAEHNIALNEMSQRIREVTLLIDTFSNETHLLALNAAIESAGAGEEGDRFAVIAGQIRKLAQRSRTSAIEIQRLIKGIQQMAARSVMATEEGIKIAAVGEKMMGEGLSANENIVRQIEHTSQLAEAISQATEQQRLVSSQVATTMEQLSYLSHTISQNSLEFLGSATNLGEVVTELTDVVAAFEIGDEYINPDQPEGLPALNSGTVTTIIVDEPIPANGLRRDRNFV